MRSLMIARPITAVTTPVAAGEPEPRHDRPADAPPAPARPRQTRAGWVEDEEERDNERGFERDETDNSFYQLVRHLVADGDQRAARAGRRAPRLLSEMEDRLTSRMAACGSCNGAGGTTTTTTSGGVTRSSWKSCGSCRGSGNS